MKVEARGSKTLASARKGFLISIHTKQEKQPQLQCPKCGLPLGSCFLVLRKQLQAYPKQWL